MLSSSCRITCIYFIFLMPAQVLSFLHSVVCPLIEALLSSFCPLLLIQVDYSFFQSFCMWVSWGVGFHCLELLLVEEDVTAAASEVWSLSSLCLFAKSFLLQLLFCFFAWISSGHLLYFCCLCTVYPSQKKYASIVCSFLICALFLTWRFVCLTDSHTSRDTTQPNTAGSCWPGQ